MMYGRLHSEKFDVDIGFDFSVLGGGICVKSDFGKKIKCTTNR